MDSVSYILKAQLLYKTGFLFPHVFCSLLLVLEVMSQYLKDLLNNELSFLVVMPLEASVAFIYVYFVFVELCCTLGQWVNIGQQYKYSIFKTNSNSN